VNRKDSDGTIMSFRVNFDQCMSNPIKSHLLSHLSFYHILSHIPTSNDDLQALKAKLTDFAHSYGKLLPLWNNSPFQGEHFRALKSLRNNEDIIITKADKGGNCVILQKSDYISKMEDVLNDETKFTKLGTVEK